MLLSIVDNLQLVSDTKPMLTPVEEQTDALSVLRASSLSQILSKELESIILNGSLAPGERLNEKALADRFGVSRGPVREAFRVLHAKGLVEMIPNRGVFVQRITKQDAIEIYDVRAGLFGTACRLLADRLTKPMLAELKTLLARMDEAAVKRDIDSYFPLNISFHSAIVTNAGNGTLAASYFTMVGRLHLFRARGLVHGGGFETSNTEHQAIVESIDSRDPQAAFEAGWAHVQNGKARIVLTGDGPVSDQEPQSG